MTARCEGAPQIYADDVVPFFLGHVRQHPVPQDSGVVDQHVQAPEELHRLVHHLLRGGKGADIRPVDNCLATLLLDLVDVARAAYDVDRLPDDVAVAIAAAEIDQLAFRLTQRRASEMGRAGQLGPHPSVLKYAGAKLTQRRRDLEESLRGASGLGWEGDGFSEEDLRAAREWLRAFGLSIEGGTSEIQLNIISKRELGLPS